VGNDGKRENYTGGYGVAAAIDSDWFGREFIQQTTELWSPVIDLSGMSGTTTLYFKSDFYSFYPPGTGQEGWFEYSTDGGTTWTTMLNFNSSVGTEWWQIDIASFGLNGQSNVVFRWRYDDYGSRDGWWQIDDVFILPDPSLTYPINVDPGFVRPEKTSK